MTIYTIFGSIYAVGVESEPRGLSKSSHTKKKMVWLNVKNLVN